MNVSDKLTSRQLLDIALVIVRKAEASGGDMPVKEVVEEMKRHMLTAIGATQAAAAAPDAKREANAG